MLCTARTVLIINEFLLFPAPIANYTQTTTHIYKHTTEAMLENLNKMMLEMDCDQMPSYLDLAYPRTEDVDDEAQVDHEHQQEGRYSGVRSPGTAAHFDD